MTMINTTIARITLPSAVQACWRGHGMGSSWAACISHQLAMKSLLRASGGVGDPVRMSLPASAATSQPWVRFTVPSPKSRGEPGMALIKLSSMRGSQHLLCVRTGGGLRRADVGCERRG